MVEQRPLGRARRLDNVIQAPALEPVPVELRKGPPRMRCRMLWVVLAAAGIALISRAYRPVGMLLKINSHY